MQDPTREPGALPGARAALTLLFLINLFNYIDRYVLAAAVGPIKKSFFGANGPAIGGVLGSVITWFQQSAGFKLEDALVGMLSTMFMITYMVMSPVFARMAERHSRWAIVGIGVLAWSLASGASGLAAGFGALLVTRCFVGIGEAAYGPVAPSIISDFYAVNVRGRKLAWLYVALPLGTALGYTLGGTVANSSIGMWAGSIIGVRLESWRWAFYLVVVPGLVLGIWSFFMRDAPRARPHNRREPTDSRAGTPWREYLVLVRTPSYVLCSLGMAAMTFAFAGIAFWMPHYLETRPGHPPAGQLFSTFGAIITVSGVLSTLAGGWAGDRVRSRFGGSYFLVSAVGMLAGFPVFLLALRMPFPWIWVWMFLTCFCLFFNTGPTNTILANVSPPAIRATAFALNIFVIHALGDVISPVVIGLLTDYFDGDMNKSFLLVGLMFLVAGGLWLWGARHLERDTALAVLQSAP
ncbi:MAG: spinster family MFS transporter [Bacteroidales bacterium]